MKTPAVEQGTETPIAIVGIGCRFAGCANVAAFWDAIMSRRSCLTLPGPEVELPFGRRNIFPRPYPARVGQLGELYSCVPAMQNFPRQVNAGENQDLYFATQLAFDALVDASMRPHPREAVRGTVRLGYAPPFNASTVNWLQHTAYLEQTMEILRRFMPSAPEELLEEARGKLVESLPEANAASFLLGTGYRFASWIARECAFAGVAAIQDAGLLSGAVSLMDAIDDLRSQRADVALAGAITPPLNRSYLEGLSSEVLFSSKPALQPFSDSPEGTVPGEGGAFFVLKRRDDALRARDRIYALLRTVAVGHTADDGPGALLGEALAHCGLEAQSVNLIEADGSGIAELENREIEGVQKLWGEHLPGGALVGIGSVKGNIGHTLRAAMAAGTAKAALALYHRVLPPQIAPERANHRLSHLSSSAYLLDDARPWITGDAASPRRAAVIGTNFMPCDPVGGASRGGRSAAILLEEEPEGSV